MTFKREWTPDGRCKVVFSKVVPYVHPLEMAPKAMEPELKSGLWLIVTFAVWSGPAYGAVRDAVTFALTQAGRIQLGVRAYDRSEDNYAWWPGAPVPGAADLSYSLEGEGAQPTRRISSSGSGQLWLVLRDGAVLYQGNGLLTPRDLGKLLHSLGVI